MPKIATQINPQDDTFKSNHALMEQQIQILTEKLSRIQQGGSESARQRHLEQGKLTGERPH